MSDTTPSDICSVCGLAPGEVYASVLGPVSYRRCQTCRDEGAESIGVVCLRIFLQGGPGSMDKGDPEHQWINEVNSYADGRYIDWPQILAIYPKYEALFEGRL